MADVDVLIPTCDRVAPLAATLASLIGQRDVDFRVVVADQGSQDVSRLPEVLAPVGVLRETGRRVELHRNVPRRGLAHQRQFLLDRADAPYVLFLDDDVLVEGDLLQRLLGAVRRERCGFVGSFVNAPSAVRSDKPADAVPPNARLELWDGPVRPERVVPGGHGWERRHLHFAAYPARLATRLGVTKERERLYKVAWVGGCVLFDAHALRTTGGFSFWEELPDTHCGEDVVAQLRVMAAFGGAGLLPSGAWHQEVPTTTGERRVDAPLVLDVHGEATDESERDGDAGHRRQRALR